MDFTGFLGNDAVKARLSGAFASGRVAHSYLLCGPAGSGKHTLTRILSAAMQCEGRSGKIPCGVCSGCRKALEGVHPDIITVDDPDHKAMTVDPIRAARSDMFIRPNEGKRKIYIIPRGQDMNESAQNALLKILEEPPDYGVFLILSTNAERLLPTIRSRAVQLQLAPLAPDEALPELQKRFPEKREDELRQALEQAEGFLGPACESLRGELVSPQALALAMAFAERDTWALLQTLVPMEKAGRGQLTEVFTQTRRLFCLALRARAGALSPDKTAQALLRGRTGAEIFAAAELLRQTADDLAGNVGVGAVVGELCVKLGCI